MEGADSPFTVEIFDVGGRRVRRFVESGSASTWVRRWDTRDEHGASVSAGIYFVRAERAEETRIERVVVLR